MRFRDRRDAGRQLAQQLLAYADDPDVTVLALPRGGVPVAYEVALALHAPLNVFIATGGVRMQPGRSVAKIEVTPQGSQRRFVVTNRDDPAEVVYRDFYVQRGRVPEQPIGEMKNGLQADRLSACGFCANAFRLLVHTLAYALVVLFREAAAAVPEVATATVSTLQQRLWKVGAVVGSGVRRIRFPLSEMWPHRELLGRALAAVNAFVATLPSGSSARASRAGMPAI
jgi:hypothetical protein